MSKRVLLLLADGFEALQAASFTDVLGWANTEGDTPINIVSAGMQPTLSASFGFSVIPDYPVPSLDLEGFDALAIPGGFESSGYFRQALSPPFSDVIRAFVARDKPIASICVASLALGAAGVLQGRRATTYHQLGGIRKAQLETYGARFVDLPLVIDGSIITAAGPGAAFEVALTLLEMLTSASNADHVRQMMRVPHPQASWRDLPQVMDFVPQIPAPFAPEVTCG